MTAPGLTVATLTALVTDTLAANTATRVIAVDALAWDGPPELDIRGQRVNVRAASSPLAVRQAMADARSHAPGDVLVVLTPCDDHQLGLDVTARFARGKRLRADVFSTVTTLLGVRAIDPELARRRWLLEEIAVLAAGGVFDRTALRAGAGAADVLSIDTAWALWYRHRLGVEPWPLRAADVVIEFGRSSVAQAVRLLPETVQDAVAEQWTMLGLPGTVLVHLVREKREADLVPYGLIVDLLGQPATGPLDEAQRTTRIRLETPFGGRDRVRPEQERVWGGASRAALDESDPEDRDRWLVGAERCLAELDAVALTELTDVFRSGLTLQLASLADALLAAWTAPTAPGVAALAGLAGRVTELHANPNAAGDARLGVVDAAMRLLQRRAYPAIARPDGLGGFVGVYMTDGGWLDRCRSLLIDGATDPALADLAAAVVVALEPDRAGRDAPFAPMVRDWEPVPASPPLAIEDVLDQVVAPLARVNPVLLLVLDGGAVAATADLLSEIPRQGWVAVGRPGMLGAIAALPTITEVSRASLLAGDLVTGTAPSEKKSFAGQSALVAASRGGPGPVLFHKGDLPGPDGHRVHATVADAVSGTRRIVGVVVNAIDDHLSGGDQVSVGWGLNDIAYLRDLLEMAATADRTVIVTADHGHVLDGNRSILRSPDVPRNGHRWRTPQRPAGEGEIEVKGRRVVTEGGHVVLAVDEGLRYGSRQHGYHGGLTPQEAIVPVAVYVRSGAAVPEGWSPIESVAPAWWEIGALPETADVEDPDAVSSGAVPAPKKPRRAKPQPDTPVLFDQQVVPPVPPTDWIGKLLASPAFRRQAEAPGRQPMAEGRVRVYLRALRRGGTMTEDALRAEVGGPPFRVRTELSTLRGLLNLDGESVLAVDGSEIRLNVDLLTIQFELGAT